MNIRKLSRRRFLQIAGLVSVAAYLSASDLSKLLAKPIPNKPVSPIFDISGTTVFIGSETRLKMTVKGDVDSSSPSYPFWLLHKRIVGGMSGVGSLNQGGMDMSLSYRVRLMDLVNSVVDYLRVKRNFVASTFAAEYVIHEIGSALPLEIGRTMVVRGNNLSDGSPMELTVSDTEIREAMKGALRRIVDPITADLKVILRRLPHSSPVRNITLTGDLARLEKLDQRLQKTTGLNVTVRESKPDFALLVNNHHGIVLSRIYSIAGVELCEAVIYYLRHHHNLLIGERTAENAIIQIGSALPLEEERSLFLRGRNLITGLPEAVEITSIELRDAIAYTASRMVSMVIEDIKTIPADLTNSAPVTGLVLRGTFGQLPGLAQRLQTATGLGVTVAESEKRCHWI
jgi:actin-like ATPase involved in cell morphogenesis